MTDIPSLGFFSFPLADDCSPEGDFHFFSTGTTTFIQT
jgi:hypothetical protein